MSKPVIKTAPADQLTRLGFLRKVAVRGAQQQSRRIVVQCVYRYPFDGHQCVSAAVAHVESCKCGVTNAPMCTAHFNKHYHEHAPGCEGLWVGWGLRPVHQEALAQLEGEARGAQTQTQLPGAEFEKWAGGIPPR